MQSKQMVKRIEDILDEKAIKGFLAVLDLIAKRNIPIPELRAYIEESTKK